MGGCACTCSCNAFFSSSFYGESGHSRSPNLKSETALPAKPDEDLWNKNIADLRRYYKRYGDANVPATTKTHRKLAGFVKVVRQVQGRLSDKRRVDLDDMKFLWKDAVRVKEDQKWEEMFQRLWTYKRVHGNVLVPDRYEGGKPKLGSWVGTQRRAYKQKRMRKDRVERLNAIDFVWVIRERAHRETLQNKLRWMCKFGELVEWHQENNHYRVPINGETRSLGKWLNTQRFDYNNQLLIDYRKYLLHNIQVPWKTQPQKDALWLEQFHTYKESVDQETLIGRSALDWASGQRLMNEKGALPIERKEMLDGIQFDWHPVKSFEDRGVGSTNDKRWQQRYQELVMFHQSNGHFRVPKEQKTLYNWVKNQHERKDRLPKQRAQLLDAAGFPWRASKTTGRRR